MTLKEKIEQEAIKYAEFNKFTSDRPFEFNRDKIAFTNGAYLYFDNLADDYAIEFFYWWEDNMDKNRIKELLEIFKKEKGYE